MSVPGSNPTELGSPVHPIPIESEGPTPFFPPVCLQSHWDPGMILKWTLPQGHARLPTDPRPWTRICMEYTTAGDNEAAPPTNPNLVLPSGGANYPFQRYATAIDNESALRRLDRPLGSPEHSQWEPTPQSDMYDARKLIPSRSTPQAPGRIQEIAFPQALIRSGPYDCRQEADNYNLAQASGFMFNNATKQDRYKSMGQVRPKPSASIGALDPAGPLGSSNSPVGI